MRRGVTSREPKEQSNVDDDGGSSPLRREVTGILLLALAVFLALSLGSFQLGSQWMGPGGALVAVGLYAVLGVAAWVAAAALAVAAVRTLIGKPVRLRSWEVVGYVAAALFAAQLLHIATSGHRVRGYSLGGLCGEYGAELMVALLGTAGAVLIDVTGLLLALMATTPITATGLGRGLARSSVGAFGGLSRVASSALAALPFGRHGDEEDEDESAKDREATPRPVIRAARSVRTASSDPDATRPLPSTVREGSREGSKESGKTSVGVAVPVPVAAAQGDTRRARVVPPPADDTPMVLDAAALEGKGRRRRSQEDADAVPAAMQQSGAGAAERTAPLPIAAPATVGAAAVLEAMAPAAFAASAASGVGPTAEVSETIAPPVIKMPPRRTTGRGTTTAAAAAFEAAPASTAFEAAAASTERPQASSGEAEARPDRGASPRLRERADRTEVDAAPAALPLDDTTEPSSAPPVALASSAAGPPAISAPTARRAPGSRAPLDYERLTDGDFRLPDLSLLDFDEAAHAEIDRQAMLDLAGRLEKTLADYGVRGRVSEIHPGPVVTMYEFVPQAGTKLSKITALSNDLAMALEALKVRIVAPIPGKAAVGIEVPNRVRETVFLKEIIGSDVFARSARSKLAMALGKDIVGNPVVVDLAKMPHLLIAGTTGSGKSVSVNAMICSLLFNASPDEVKMIMIDPKMLELSIYEGIPHLLLPVVTDPKKANLALRWAVEEMERRYDLISRSGVRDIASYNKKVEKRAGDHGAERARPVEPPRPMVKIVVSDGPGGGRREVEVDANVTAVQAAGGIVDSQILDDISAAVAAAQSAAMQQMELLAAEPERKLPYIVIVIDEFADLMMVASKEVEQSVARIAQKARAAGIHLMLATQRPSVDVITGLIKANFPSRIAFQVASRIDSRTILDQQGAESLLGMGDMLFTDRGLALRRIHGPLVTDGEIHRIVEQLRAQGKPVYDLDILKPRAEDGEEGGEGGDDLSDEMYDQAVAVVSEMRQASTSMLQRRLRLGYNRAARLIERMEREGIVGPADGARPREVLIRSHAA